MLRLNFMEISGKVGGEHTASEKWKNKKGSNEEKKTIIIINYKPSNSHSILRFEVKVRNLKWFFSLSSGLARLNLSSMYLLWSLASYRRCSTLKCRVFWIKIYPSCRPHRCRGRHANAMGRTLSVQNDRTEWNERTYVHVSGLWGMFCSVLLYVLVSYMYQQPSHYM